MFKKDARKETFVTLKRGDVVRIYSNLWFPRQAIYNAIRMNLTVRCEQFNAKYYKDKDG